MVIKISDMLVIIYEESRAVGYSKTYINTQSVTTIVLQYRQLVKNVFNVSAILIHDTLQKAIVCNAVLLFNPEFAICVI